MRNIDGIEVEVSVEQVQLAIEFSLAVNCTVDYSDCNQGGDKVRLDHAQSKVTESAAVQALRQTNLFRVVSNPDYAIYHGETKGWRSDVVAQTHDGVEMQCGIKGVLRSKARGLSRSYFHNGYWPNVGPSWTFQKHPGGRVDKTLENPDGWHVFVEMGSDIDEQNVKPIRCVVWGARQGKDFFDLLRDPISRDLVGKKIVVYAHDLFGIDRVMAWARECDLDQPHPVLSALRRVSMVDGNISLSRR